MTNRPIIGPIIPGRIVPGIELDQSGQVSVNASMGRQLISLALDLESYTSRPVDVQHVLAAIILAVNRGDLIAGQSLPEPDPTWMRMLASHVESIFQQTGGRVSEDD
jgi:hypothetical protein